MKFFDNPFFYYYIFGSIFFIGIEIFILEKSTLGAVISGILFILTLIFFFIKKRRLKKKPNVDKAH